ncbi:unnamed protein product [Soboliphyme baturini]|uniref:Nuclear receptor domain-containing protein n=1 Tax=Soboliphyme baturini TaxID=241478 RepID=A0A183IRV6_9BILA|nr:unnamed protein product [Soboliphyme baturini]
MRSYILGRILLDIPCKVCHDHSSGKHYGIFACDGCAGFFKRSIRRNRQYVCKAKGLLQEGNCMVDKTHRNQCRSCRLNKCINSGMNKEAVQHERGPRNSTLRRQMSLYFKGVDQHDTIKFGSSVLTAVNGDASTKHAMISSNGCFPHYSPNLLFNPLLRTTVGMAPSELVSLPPFPSSTLFLRTVNEPPPKMDWNKVHLTERKQRLKEQAARLLFLTISWPKTIPQLTILPQTQQVAIIKSTWFDIFLLTIIQFNLLTKEDAKWLKAVTSRSEWSDEIEAALEVFEKFQAAHIDAFEYCCLRCLTLICSDIAFQQQVYLTLNSYHQLQYPWQCSRSSKLLQLLPLLHTVPSDALVRLLFRDAIGDISIHRLVCDMFLSDGQQDIVQSVITQS